MPDWNVGPRPTRLHLRSFPWITGRKRLVFLAGAGISLRSPSNLPSGRRLLEEILRHVLRDVDRGLALDLANPERRNKRTRGDYLRFESVLEELTMLRIDPGLEVLRCFATATEPNRNHVFLHQVILAGHTVITTNFDTLIERSLLAHGHPFSQIVTTVDYRRAFRKTREHAVYKLHGSSLLLSPVSARWRDGTSTIKATLTAIGRSEIRPSIDPFKVRVLEQLLRSAEVIVVGYSGQDDLDVLPLLLAISRSASYTWVVHSSARSSYRMVDACFLHLMKRRRHPYYVNGDGDFLSSRHAFVHALGEEQGRCNEFRLVEVNTDAFIELLARRLRITLPMTPSGPSSSSHFELQGWPPGGIPSPAARHHLAARLFVSSNRLNEAAAALKRFGNAGRSSHRPDLIASAQLEMATLHFRRRQHGPAIRMYRRVLQTASDHQLRARASHQLALILMDRGHLQEAWRLLARNRGYFGVGRDHGRLGLTLQAMAMVRTRQGRLQDALNLYERAAVEAAKAGDVHALAGTYHQRAVLNRRMGLFREARLGFAQAIEVAKALGDEGGVALSQWGTAQVFIAEGNPRTAVALLRRSLSSFEHLLDSKNIAGILVTLAEAQYALGERSSARRMLASAKERARRLLLRNIEDEVTTLRKRWLTEGGTREAGRRS